MWIPSTAADYSTSRVEKRMMLTYTAKSHHFGHVWIEILMWLSVNNAFLSKDHVTQSSNSSRSSGCFSETTCSTRSCQLAFVLLGFNFMLRGKNYSPSEDQTAQHPTILDVRMVYLHWLWVAIASRRRWRRGHASHHTMRFFFADDRSLRRGKGYCEQPA